MPVVEVTRLEKRYGAHPALLDVDLTLQPGEVFGYLGPNGAGKTTTIRILLGLLRATAGSARVLGLDAWRDRARIHARCGYVPGETGLYDRMTGDELLRYFGRLRGGYDATRVQALSERLDVDLSRKVGTLSRGNRQKVVIVQSLMHQPELLILDEPTSGLDPLGQLELQRLLAEHTAAGGTVLLSSHVLDEVQRVADRVGIIRAGRLVAVERLAELRARSLHHVSARFTDAVEPAAFGRIGGVRDLQVHDHTITCKAPETSLDELVKAFARHHVVDLECEPASLDETFLAFYGEEASTDA